MCQASTQPLSSHLFRLRPVVLCLSLAVSLAVAPVGFAQEKVRLNDVNDRLVRVERVLDQSLLELLQQVESLKREIRILRGELENQTYELSNVRKRNRDLYLDTDQRITDLEDRVDQQGLINLEAETSGSIDGLDIDDPSDGDGQTPVFVTTDEAEEPDVSAALSAAGDSATGNAIGNTPSEEVPAVSAEVADPVAEKVAYAKAYDLLADGDQQAAVAGFKAFLQKYPNGNYADNAWYWQGEALYAQREFSEAISLFKNVVNTFPQSPKVPDARLKIAYALYEQERYGESRAELIEVATDYPGRAAGTLAAKRLAEMNSKGL